MSEPYIGTIMMFGGNFAISGYQMCNGQLLAIQTNTALFSIVGTSFGGNGVQTFGLPDFRGRVPIHQGTGPSLSPYVLGQSGGTESVVLNQSQMPAHSHLVSAVGTAASANSLTPQNAVPVATAGKPEIYSTTVTTLVTMNPAMIKSTGGNSPFPVLQPFLTVTFLIALVGLYPSRN
jgi:microcystin-dependent protein